MGYLLVKNGLNQIRDRIIEMLRVPGRKISSQSTLVLPSALPKCDWIILITYRREYARSNVVAHIVKEVVTPNKTTNKARHQRRRKPKVSVVLFVVSVVLFVNQNKWH